MGVVVTIPSSCPTDVCVVVTLPLSCPTDVCVVVTIPSSCPTHVWYVCVAVTSAGRLVSQHAFFMTCFLVFFLKGTPIEKWYRTTDYIIIRLSFIIYQINVSLLVFYLIKSMLAFQNKIFCWKFLFSYVLPVRWKQQTFSKIAVHFSTPIFTKLALSLPKLYCFVLVKWSSTSFSWFIHHPGAKE